MHAEEFIYPFYYFILFLVEDIDVKEGRKELKLLPLASQHSLNGFNPMSPCKIPTFLVEVIHVIFSEEQIGACRRCPLPWNARSRPFGECPSCISARRSRPAPRQGVTAGARPEPVQVEQTSVRTAIARKAALLLRV